MFHPEHTQDELDTLAFYALGLLEQDEHSKWTEHLNAGCMECEIHLVELREAAACVGFGARQVEPPATLRDRVLAVAENRAETSPGIQVWKQWMPIAFESAHVVRSEQGEWKDVQPGIAVKQLYVDRERDSVTMLIRMSPGTSYGRHLHAGAEQCFVLEGDLSEGQLVVTAGDYQCLPAGSTHGVQKTHSGCLLLIVSSLHDQLLD